MEPTYYEGRTRKENNIILWKYIKYVFTSFIEVVSPTMILISGIHDLREYIKNVLLKYSIITLGEDDLELYRIISLRNTHIRIR